MAGAAQAITEKLAEIEQELVEPRITTQLDMVHFPTRLNAKLAALPSVVASADAAPTRQSHDVFADLSARIDQQLERWRDTLEVDVASFNAVVRGADLPGDCAARRKVTRDEHRDGSLVPRPSSLVPSGMLSGCSTRRP